jgi:hypothetical protein
MSYHNEGLSKDHLIVGMRIVLTIATITGAISDIIAIEQNSARTLHTLALVLNTQAAIITSYDLYKVAKTQDSQQINAKVGAFPQFAIKVCCQGLMPFLSLLSSFGLSYGHGDEKRAAAIGMLTLIFCSFNFISTFRVNNSTQSATAQAPRAAAVVPPPSLLTPLLQQTKQPLSRHASLYGTMTPGRAP